MQYKGWVEEVFAPSKHIRIVEIGVFRGEFGCRLIRTAKLSAPAAVISYVGIDAFDTLNERSIVDENSLHAPSQDVVYAAMNHECPYAEIELIRGNSKEVLPTLARELAFADLVYIDGGHSLDTISADWAHVSCNVGNHTTVVFDDIYEGRDDIGAQALVANIDRKAWCVEITEAKAYESQIGPLMIRQAVVRRKEYFERAQLDMARQVILEPIDGQHRRWEEETTATIQLILDHVSPSDRICDFGCGVGRIALPLARFVRTIDAVDQSHSMLAHLRSLSTEYANLELWNLNDWLQATDNGPYDVFLCIFVLQHINESLFDTILDAFTTRAAPGARLFVVNTPGRFVPVGESYVDDHFDVRGILLQRFELVMQIPLGSLGKTVAEHHFCHIYRVRDES